MAGPRPTNPTANGPGCTLHFDSFGPHMASEAKNGYEGTEQDHARGSTRPPPFRMSRGKFVGLVVLSPIIALCLLLLGFVGMWLTMVLSTLWSVGPCTRRRYVCVSMCFVWPCASGALGGQPARGGMCGKGGCTARRGLGGAPA